MAVANLPAKIPQSSVPDDYAEALARQISQGIHPKDIALRLHPKDRAARRRAYKRLRSLALEDPRVAANVVADAKLALIVALGPTIEALGRHAQRRPDAAKLVLEASGFHNPRVQHEHSGDIKITLDMPRPKFVDNEEAVVDAEVVD